MSEHDTFPQQKRVVYISRKDTIVIAVLVNTMLLALLFALANKRQPDAPVEDVLQQKNTQQIAHVAKIGAPVDELDEIIQQYAQKAHEKEALSVPPPTNAYVVEVKKGDSLAKIAKNYGVKVEDIVTLNELSTQKLRIGQQLRIPKVVAAEQEEYYVIKSGDNPWKLARKFHIQFEELLKLNNLDEDSAKSLKIGDTIRVR